MRRIESFDWWPELLTLKDELSLRELSDRFGVTPGAISAALKRTNTQRRPAPSGPRARRGVEGADAEGEPKPRPGSKDELLLPHVELLGTMPDAEVAERAGVSVRTVASFRARHHIPGYVGPRKSGERSSKLEPFVDLLGQLPDREVAQRAGVSAGSVRLYRNKLGIAPASSQSKEPRSAWRVTTRAGAVHAVTAATLVEAARRAEVVGEVLSIEWVGTLL